MLIRFSILFWIIVQLSLSFAAASDFVKVRGTEFIHKGKPFRFLGTNAYFLLHEASLGNWKVVEDVYLQAQAANMTVVRTWAFNDTGGKGNTLQLSPGVYNENVFRALDYVVAKAREYNLKLILVLVNNWSDYGGMMQYVRWSPTAKTHSDFYTDPSCREFYKQYVAHVMNRKNTMTNVLYKNDPTIMAWELANEPTSSDASGRIVRQWLDSMSAYIKSINTNHLLGTGEAGFDNNFVAYDNFLSTIPLGQQRLDWLLNGTKGVSFTMNLQLPHIDYAGCNIYPDQYNISVFQAVQLLRDRKMLATKHKKPFVVTELGKRMNKLAAYEAMIGSLFEFGAAGVCIWQLTAPTGHDVESFRIRSPEEDDVLAYLRMVGEQLSLHKPLPSTSSFFDETKFPIVILRDGKPFKAETKWDGLSFEDEKESTRLRAQMFQFGEGGFIELFPKGILSMRNGKFLRLWVRAAPDSEGDLWIETHVRGQWLSSYRSASPFWQLIDIPLSDLGIENDFLERVKFYAPKTYTIAMAKIEIVGGRSAMPIESPKRLQGKRSNSQIYLRWNHSDEKEIVGYKIYRSANIDSRHSSRDLYAFTKELVFVDTSHVQSSPMTYAITAVGSRGEESQPTILRVE